MTAKNARTQWNKSHLVRCPKTLPLAIFPCYPRRALSSRSKAKKKVKKRRRRRRRRRTLHLPAIPTANRVMA
jgi:hypothetical protein